MPLLRSILSVSRPAAQAALLLAAAFGTPAPAGSSVGSPVWVDVVGRAAADRSDARAAALKDALRHAVEAGAGVRVASESVTDHAELTRDIVTVTSTGHVRSYRITAENPDDAGHYAVRLSADVVPNVPGPLVAPVHRIRVVAQGQPPQTAAHAAQRLRERGLHTLSSDDSARPTDTTLVLHVAQHCAPAPDAYGLPLVRADVSVTVTLVRANPDVPQAGATATRHAFGSTAAAAADRAHQRALDAALEQALHAGGLKFFTPSRNP